MLSAALALLLFAGADPTALSQQALAAAQQKDFATAEKLWTQALQQQPDLFEANFNLGYMLQSRGDNARAAPLLQRAAAAQPDNFNARYVLGAVLSRLGRTDEAVKHWRAALALRPAEVRLMQILAVEYSKGRYFRDAAALAESALGKRRDDPSLWLLAIRARQDAADHETALRLAEQMWAALPGNPRAAFEIGYEHVRAGMPDKGLPWLQKALTAAEPWEEPFYFYGDLMLKSGQYAEAESAFRRALQLRRDYMPAWAGLARTLMARGELDSARSTLLEAVKVDQQHPQPHLLLSQVYFRLGDEAAATREKELASRLRQARPEALESLPGRTYSPGQ